MQKSCGIGCSGFIATCILELLCLNRITTALAIIQACYTAAGIVNIFSLVAHGNLYQRIACVTPQTEELLLCSQMLAFLNRSVTIWLLCHNKKPSLCSNGYTGTHFIYGLQNQRAKSQQYAKLNLKNSQVNILDVYSPNYLNFNLPIIPEVTLKGHQTRNTKKNTKLEDFIYFQS